MKKTEIVLIAALFCLVILPHTGFTQQSKPVFSAPVDTVTSSRYVANIRVRQFNKIVGAQFTLAWNPSVLTFDSVGQFGLPFTISSNFGLQSAQQGILRFAWSEEGLKGIDLKDDVTLFSIFFRPVGQVNATSLIQFVDTPTMKEVVDVSFAAVQAEFRNGSVVIGQQSVTSVLTNEPEWLNIRSAFPNPLHKESSLQVEFFSRAAEDVAVRILDVQGKVCFEQQYPVSSGVNQLRIDANNFPVSGVYFVRLTQGDRFSTQKVLFR